LIKNFRNFYQKFPYLDIQECIEYYSIFEGYPFLDQLDLSCGLNDAIEKGVIFRIEELKEYFKYSSNKQDQELLEKILARISRGDRKNYAIYSKEGISQFKGRELFGYLFNLGLIYREKSRERPIKTTKKQLIKKSLRRYTIQDKIHISSNFTRFWFTFISYRITENTDIKFSSIMPYLEKYISLEFEKLSNLLIIELYKKEGIVSYGSYWDKDIEIDLFIVTKEQKIAGEAKWKNSKICKNTLNSLKNKCKVANLEVDKFALFSKSGFSKELQSKNYQNTLLLELKDFEKLYQSPLDV